MAEHYEGADVVRQAALLASGISQAQAFMDGNKRTAFLATDVFLERNGLVLTGDPLAFVQRELRLVRELWDRTQRRTLAPDDALEGCAMKTTSQRPPRAGLSLRIASRSQRLTRLRTTAVPTRLDTVTPKRSAPTKLGLANHRKCGVTTF